MKSGRVALLSFWATLAVLAGMLLVGNSHPAPDSVNPPYECWKNHDHNENTFKKIDCTKKYNGIDASKFSGCQEICTPHSDCYGLTWIPPPRSNYKDGKICCFLKTEIIYSKLKHQQKRDTCKWISSN